MMFSSLNRDFFTEFSCRKTLLPTGPRRQGVTDLRATAIRLGNTERGQLEVVREEDELVTVRGVAQLHSKLCVGVESARRADEAQREALVDAPITFLVRISQCAARD